MKLPMNVEGAVAALLFAIDERYACWEYALK